MGSCPLGFQNWGGVWRELGTGRPKSVDDIGALTQSASVQWSPPEHPRHEGEGPGCLQGTRRG